MAYHVSIASALVLLSLVVVTHAQSWDYEKQRTLAEMMTLRRGIIGQRHPIFSDSEAGEFALNNSAVTSRVKLRYMGERRQISVAKRRLLAAVARTYALNPESTKQLAEEILFKEGNRQYWIPVRKEVFPAVERVKTGDEITLYIDLVGAYRTKGRWEWVFTVNDIAEPEPQQSRTIEETFWTLVADL
jgi:hypothetical protein